MGTPWAPTVLASVAVDPGPALRGWGPPAQVSVTPAPSSLQPTSAGLQKHSPTSPRSTCTPTGRPWRAARSRPPLPPPTASVPTSVPRPRTRGASGLGKNWTRTEGAGETAPWGPPAPTATWPRPSAVTASEADLHGGCTVTVLGKCHRRVFPFDPWRGASGRGRPAWLPERSPFPASTLVFPHGRPAAPALSGTHVPRAFTSSTTCRPRRGPARPPGPRFLNISILVGAREHFINFIEILQETLNIFFF